MSPRLAVIATWIGVLALAGCSTQASPNAATITGLVEQGPTCPVETLESPCPPDPVEGAFVDVLQDGQVVASTTTDGSGRFVVNAPVGAVEVRALSSEGLPSQDSRSLTLVAGNTADVSLLLDTGIR